MRERVNPLRSRLVRALSLSSASLEASACSFPASCDLSPRHFGDRAARIATLGNPFTVADSSDAVPHPRDFSMRGGDLACFPRQVSLRTPRSSVNHATSLKVLGKISSIGARVAPLILSDPEIAQSISHSPSAPSCAARVWFSRHCRRAAACAVIPESILEEAVSCTH